MARRKSTNRGVQKGGVITVGKARQDIASRKADEVLVANRAFIRAQKFAHQAVLEDGLPQFLQERQM